MSYISKKLSNRNKDIYDNLPEALVSVTIKVPYEVHKALLEFTKAALVKEIRYNSISEHENIIAAEFKKWRETTEEGMRAGLEAFNVAARFSQLEARRFLREEFFKANPGLKKPLSRGKRSPTGYSREDVGRIVTEALEIARTKLRNKYLKG